jgi:outer membrane protein TolC
MQLHLRDALDLALKQNLGIVTGTQNARAARAEKLLQLSHLLPNVTAGVTESEQQINLAAFGFPAPAGTSPIIGPFSVSDARAFLGQRIFDWNAIQNERSANFSERAAQLSQADARELVTLFVTNAYLQAVASEARVGAAQSQLETAKSSYDQASNMRKAGMVAGIDVLRAQVEVAARQQRLMAVSNDFEKQKLDLARMVGLAAGQQFELADKMPYAPAPVVNLPQALEQAYAQRVDYQSAQALLQSAEAARQAAVGEAYPSLRFDGNYGDIGKNFANSHGTFTAAASLDIPIFQGGKVRADVMRAEALVEQRKAEVESLRGDIEAEVRKALLDVQSASDQVQVTKGELEVAQQALAQSRDRFAAGVADNLEVVQAQEAVATANDAYISSVYAHNIAKATLARAVGIAEKAVKEFLGERP